MLLHYSVLLKNLEMLRSPPRNDSSVRQNDLMGWCRNNCKGNFAGYICACRFELEEDVVLFKLIWG
jgi:hypothetical protein